MRSAGSSLGCQRKVYRDLTLNQSDAQCKRPKLSSTSSASAPRRVPSRVRGSPEVPVPQIMVLPAHRIVRPSDQTGLPPKNCHRCKKQQPDRAFAHCAYGRSHQFCSSCVKFIKGVSLDVLDATKWLCPVCDGTCRCTECETKRTTSLSGSGTQ